MIPLQIRCDQATRARPDHTCAPACGDTDSGVSSSLSLSRPPPNQARQSRFWIPRPAAQPKRSTGGWAGRPPASSRTTPRRRPHRCAVPHHPLLQGSDLNRSWRTATRIGPSMFAIPIACQVARAPAGRAPGGSCRSRAGQAAIGETPPALPARGSRSGTAVSWPVPGTPQAVPGLAWPDTQPWWWPSLAMVPHSGHTRCAQQAGSPPSPGSPAVGAAPVTGSESRVGLP